MPVMQRIVSSESAWRDSSSGPKQTTHLCMAPGTLERDRTAVTLHGDRVEGIISIRELNHGTDGVPDR